MKTIAAIGQSTARQIVYLPRHAHLPIECHSAPIAIIRKSGAVNALRRMLSSLAPRQPDPNTCAKKNLQP